MVVVGGEQELPDDGILTVDLDRQHQQTHQKVLIWVCFGGRGRGFVGTEDLGLAGLAVAPRGGRLEHLNWKISN